MQTFAELLTAYMDRTGIGDAELARRIPVSRPTLLRWKEGVTTRPRYREDVVRCAEILRLTADEADTLLLAAGFSPETAPPASESPEPVPAPAGPEPSPDDAGTWLFRRRFWITGAAAPLLVIAAIAAIVALRARDDTVYPAAVGNESLIVLAPFVNYTAGGQGFNVVGRLRSAIDAEVREAGLTSVRTVEWPREIDGEPAAENAGRRSDAALVIWGEYDSGRVIARFTVPRSRPTLRDQQIVDIASSPAELPATINIGLTGEVRYVALLTLGQLYLEQDDSDRAKTVLLRAMDPPPSEPAALANLRFLLGRAYMEGDLADYDEAVWLFTQVLAVRANSVEALNSRALAYLARARPGDADLAVDDLVRATTFSPDRAASSLNLAVAYLERGAGGDADRALTSLNDALAIDPDYAGAYVNRAGAYIARGGPGDVDRAFDDIEKALDLEPDLASAYLNRGNAYLARGEPGDAELAIAELSRAIELSPDSPEAHFNRGLIHSELEDWSASLTDLRRARDLDPRRLTYNNTLCLQLAVTGNAAEAMPYCDKAVAADPGGLSRDSRGLAHALLGRNDEAVADFEAFLAWVDRSQKDGCRSRYGASRAAWVEALKADDEPFDPAALPDLRPRPIVSIAAPC